MIASRAGRLLLSRGLPSSSSLSLPTQRFVHVQKSTDPEPTATTPPAAVPIITQTSTNTDVLTITKSAGLRIQKLEKLKGAEQRLRISVDAGGCSGFEYVFEMESPNQTEEDDIQIICPHTSSTIITDPSSLPLISGSKIDYEESLIRSAFSVVDNPNSETACGCGSSFALKNFEGIERH
ncbi:hypothetical protein TrLO_g13510 [Triparma laevis f. longispina]|uniref:Core domain-containing protein n=1 Tax=Triparma laevis f. longispina TaxID=1714387 RepID=A0A9W7KZN9_9STRA|nr:hypothetical protein TrLO_g13510 [Triparma laevis f. longispina]